ncbi:hypothetical protein [Turicibacter sanguinis]|uniref:hypothetical protein n=1 Tax=Turicibacter sanguinis TaxID=154288 RepID=UPI0006C1CEAA|nr:hypothetical protein [Turicibacter sanguinis]CUM89581.1 Uncharacterised protein [Turicibacter sanguinis]
MRDILPDVSGYNFITLEYLISRNYLQDGVVGAKQSRIMFVACCNELLKRLNEERSWDVMSQPFQTFERFKGKQLSLF